MSPDTSITVHPTLAAISPKGTVQYTRDSAEFTAAWLIHRGFNRIEVVNNSSCDVAIDPDFMTARRILIISKSSRTVDMLWFHGFDITNLDAINTVALGQLDLNVMWERPLMREKVS